MAEYVTVKEFCDLLKVSRQAVSNWRKEGMPYEKFGKLVRIDKDKAYQWLKERDKSGK